MVERIAAHATTACKKTAYKTTAMGTGATVLSERTTVGGSLEIPRMLNGLWQLAGGHDKDVDIANASAAMDTL